MVSGLLVLMLVFSCSSPPPAGKTTTTTTTTGGSTGDDDSADDKDKSSCVLPKCSGSKCCNKKKKDEKEDCEDWCGGSKYLGLSGKAEDKCLALDYDFIDDDLLFIFGDDLLAEPDDEKLLDEIKAKDIDTICGAVRELDSDIWLDFIEDYSNSEAEAVLGWIAQEEDAVQIFEKTGEEGIKMFKELLIQLAGGSPDTSAKVLEGLQEGINFNDDPHDNVVAMALEENNDALVKFIHKKIIKDDDEGLCGEDKENSNWPNPQVWQATPAPPHGYGVDPDDGDPDDIRKYFENANKNREESCILGVYCQIFPTGSSGSETENDSVRKDLADVLDDRSLRNFIKDEVEDGGLGLTKDQAEDWPHKVCDELGRLWNQGSSGFNLGLGT